MQGTKHQMADREREGVGTEEVATDLLEWIEAIDGWFAACKLFCYESRTVEVGAMKPDLDYEYGGVLLLAILILVIVSTLIYFGVIK